MTENPRVEKLKVPTPEMNDLLVWLVRPIGELERKFEGQYKEMKELVENCRKEAESLKEFIGDMKDQFDKFCVIPSKQENRISALESKLKFYDDVLNDIKELKEQDVQKAKKIDQCKEDFGKQQNDIVAIREVQAGLKRQANSQDHFCQDIQEKHRAFVELYNERQEAMKKDDHDLREELKDERVERKRLEDQFMSKHEMIQEKLKLFNQHLDQAQTQLAQADKDQALQCMNAVESVKKNLVENMMPRLVSLEKYQGEDDERGKALRYEVELVEKRCEKLATMVKELKAERGV